MAGVEVEHEGLVGVVELRRPPHNFFDAGLIGEIATAFEALDADPDCRAIVLAAEGRSFCAGADFSGQRPAAGSFSGGGDGPGSIGAGSLYHEGPAPVRHRHACGRSGARAGHRWWPGPGAGRRLPGDLPRGPLVQLRSPGFPSRVRPDGDAARARRWPARPTAVLHRAGIRRPGGIGIGWAAPTILLAGTEEQ
ncbi:MAG TPA: enoyl-CoA hydratase-related protein [Acidimicrobiales bacterium]